MGDLSRALRIHQALDIGHTKCAISNLILVPFTGITIYLFEYYVRYGGEVEMVKWN